MLKGFIQTKTATDLPFSQEQNKTVKAALTKIKQKHCKHFKITKTSQKKHIGSNVSAHSEGDQDCQKGQCSIETTVGMYPHRKACRPETFYLI